MPLTTDIFKTGSPNFFLSESYISNYIKVRGPDILRIGIVSGYVTFYQIKKFSSINFSLLTKVFAAGFGRGLQFGDPATEE